MTQQRPRSLRSAHKTSARASRHAKPVMSYIDPPSDIDTETPPQSDGGGSNIIAKHQKRRGPERPARSPKRRRKQSHSYVPSNPSQSLPERPNRNNPRESHTGQSIRTAKLMNHQNLEPDAFSARIIPPWSSLPYQILLQIFQHASYPLYDDRTFQPSASVEWLVRTSRLCRAFAEPALTVLYRLPPLVPMERAHKLRRLLMADPDSMSYNYRAKVERIEMEVSQTAAYTLSGSGLLDLYGLIYNCPRLLDLELYHQKDMSPYRNLDDSIKWTYPDALFYALDNNVTGKPTSLRSWRWSSRLAGKKLPIEHLHKIHQSPSFSTLRKLAFVNYQKPLSRRNTEDPQHEKLLAESLSVLDHLEHLVIESSTIANSILLPLLPNNLKHLELINCWEITSEDLASFLVTHGGNLRTLILNHNQSLNLSFLTLLGSACGKLESLKMNLTYYNVHSTYRDSEPQYKQLLAIDEKPDWPSSLQIIELTQLRNWDVETAKMFFQSLLGSAPNLANMRRLVIKAILNTNWRERSSFRDKWVGAFDRVFKRRPVPPNPHLRSLGSYAEHKRQIGGVRSGNISREEDKGIARWALERRHLHPHDDHLNEKYREENASSEGNRAPYTPKSRRSTRIAMVNLPSSTVNIENGPPGSPETIRKHITHSSFRETSQCEASANRSHSSDSISQQAIKPESDSDDEPLARRIQAARFERAEEIQGMCEVVSITIDNLRPTETQFVEADFLDSEPSGDSDWDGTEDLAGERDYAW